MQNATNTKLTQAICFLINISPQKSLTKMQIYKLLWLVDRFSLRSFGYLVTNDVYYAMPHGPVGTHAKDLIDSSVTQDELSYRDEYLRINDRTVTVVEQPDADELSELDKSSLRTVASVFSGQSAWALRNYSHKFPEWRRFEAQIEAGTRRSHKIQLDDFFKDPDSSLHKYIFLQQPEQLEQAKHVYHDQKAVSELFS